jgi:hypothetical protein
LFEDAIECAGSEIIPWLASNGDTTWLGCMFVLRMAATSGNQIPTILFDHLDRFPNLDFEILSNNLKMINFCITAVYSCAA